MFSLSPRKFHSILILPALVSLLALIGAKVLVNNPPVANDDSYTRHGNGTIGPVLANDFDPDGDRMTASVVTFPSHGSLFGLDGSSFLYGLTDTTFVGTDSFTYRACDPQQACSNIARSR